MEAGFFWNGIESLLAAKVVVLSEEVIKMNESVIFFSWDIIF